MMRLLQAREGRVAAKGCLEGRGRLLATVALVLVPVPALLLSLANGGFFTAGWSLAAIFLSLLLLGVSAALAARRIRLHRYTALALGLLSAYAAWSLTSLLWASDDGAVWEGGGKTLLYLVCFWAVVVLASAGASRRWVLGASVLGPSAIAVITLLALSSRMEGFFRDGRLEESLGYFNGEAAFLLLPFWVAVYLGGSTRVNPLVRGAVLAGAVLCADVALLTQSRGAMVAMAVSLPVFFVLSRRRLRGLLALVPVAAAVFVAFPSINGVYLAFVEDGNPRAAFDAAAPEIWIGALWAGLYGVAWGVIDGWWRPPERLVSAAGAAALALLIAVTVIGGVQFYRSFGSPVELAGQKWSAFKTDSGSGEEESRYLSASGSGRFNLWEVAVKDFRAHPLLGVGVHNYEATYYQLREEDTGYVQQPHSLPLEVLSERGIVGGALFFGFLAVCGLYGLRQRFRTLNAEGGAQFGALGAAFSYWLVHSSAEWFWQIPAVTILAFVYLGLLSFAWGGEQEEEEVVSGRLLPVAGAVVAALALVMISPLYLSSLSLERSYGAGSLEQTLKEVEKAPLFNPFSTEAVRREADVSISAGNVEKAEQAYKEEISLHPEHYAPYFLLGKLYERNGQPEEALSYYRQAHELNPLDEDIRERLEQAE